ncbi:hypothetical protein [Psychrosphaera aestuarii]|uniref:hypothetical protein n=1 Tax=Psychrosphaera aestuarii TaxID=1266052 RepID=UPI001B33F7A9|nr:hypothetical protein [Psychrosphaera aestuarii]
MKKVAIAISILAFVIIYFLPKEQSRFDKLRTKNDSNQVTYEHLIANEKISTEADFEEKVFTTSEEYLYKAKQIRRCNTIPKTQDELDDWLIKANEVGEPHEYIEDVLLRFEQCSPFQFISEDFVELLFLAIELGYDNAIAELWAVSDNEYLQSKGLDELNREETIEQRVEFNKLKYRLSERIALAGGENALLRLVKGYQNDDPDTGKPNYIKAIAYADFGLNIVKSNDVYLKLDFMKRRISLNMDLQSLEEAQTLTESLLSQLNKTETNSTVLGSSH